MYGPELEKFIAQHGGEPFRVEDWSLLPSGAWFDNRGAMQPPSADPYINLQDRFRYANLRAEAARKALSTYQRCLDGLGPPLTWHVNLGPPPHPDNVLAHLLVLMQVREAALQAVRDDYDALPESVKIRGDSGLKVSAERR
jgi:hypothetical protein